MRKIGQTSLPNCRCKNVTGRERVRLEGGRGKEDLGFLTWFARSQTFWETYGWMEQSLTGGPGFAKKTDIVKYLTALDFFRIKFENDPCAVSSLDVYRQFALFLPVFREERINGIVARWLYTLGRFTFSLRATSLALHCFFSYLSD